MLKLLLPSAGAPYKSSHNGANPIYSPSSSGRNLVSRTRALGASFVGSFLGKTAKPHLWSPETPPPQKSNTLNQNKLFCQICGSSVRRAAICRACPALACCITICIVSQAAWYRMDNRPKSKMEKQTGQKIENGRRPEMEKMAQQWRKNGIWGDIYIYILPFPHFGPRAIFYVFANFCFLIVRFRPVFHSIPGRLTRNVYIYQDPSRSV